MCGRTGLVGVKLHPTAHACSPDSKDGEMLIQEAAKLNIPVLIHTGAGIPASLPANVIPVAKKYPEAVFVLAHCVLRHDNRRRRSFASCTVVPECLS